MAFLSVVPEKSLELGDDEKLHRARKEQFITQSLEAAQLGGGGQKVVKTLRGGGVAVEHISDSAKIATFGPFIAALTGNLHNYGYLVKKYLHEELQLPATVTLEAIKERMPVTEAALLCHLYAQLGTAMLSKLRGHFSFVLYDSNTVRVLAARDPSGMYPLVQGHFADNALYVTSGSFQPADAQEVVNILPGHYKYGWRAPPRKYSNPEVEVKSHAKQASNAADEALAGIFCSHQPLAVNPWLTNLGYGGRRSMDGAPRTGPKRNSLEFGRSGNSRRSLDSTVLRNPRQGLDSHKPQSRADEKGWWRAKDEETAANPALPPAPEAPEHSGAPKKHKRHRKRHRKSKAAAQATEAKPAESDNEHSSDSGSDHKSVVEFINQLSTVFRKDSASARMLTNLLGASPCALVVTDANQEDAPIVFVNEQFELSTGYTAQEVVGKNCRFLQAAPGAPRVPSQPSSTIRRALDTGKSTSVKLMNYKKDGSPVWNDLSIVPLRDTEGKITHHVGMQTFTPAQDAITTKRTLAGASSMVRSRSCSDMSVMDKAAPLHTGGLAF
ncbi:unnamed protein product [Ostreobium quekettii]|uniref:PAS domain-containing protein n=1 Tax=Ostreobium quekettii TaxID=121088 RepID=A0A8S1IQN7_9CHLO|nr:unnamed protein product [Ostreobium quekettii]